MKKLLSILLFAMLALPMMAEDNGLIRIDVPAGMDIRDKVILVNHSPCKILQARLVWENGNQQRLVGSCHTVAPAEEVTMAEYADDGLALFRGKQLILKVKAIKKTAPQPGADSSAIADEEITYDFTARIYAKRHDLYIEVTDIEPPTSSSNLLDF